MQKLVKEYLDERNRQQKKKRKVRIAVMLLAIMVIGSVAGVLTQFGVAMTDKAKCGLEEHTHSDACYEDVLICEVSEGEGHTHTAECNYPEELICGQEESTGHTHTEECRLPEELICGQEESEEHTHTEECYQIPEGYACGLEESEGHAHTEECYQIPEGYACGLEESEGHTHTEACYNSELACGKEEHTHTDICYTDAAADVEDPSVWDNQYAAVEWKEIWGEDLVTAAQMQLGYQESANNYIVAADGNHKGYTRYGQFAGNMYMDWDGAFVNFCIHYAGLEKSGRFPAETDTAKWCEEFTKISEENGVYLTAPAAYTPKAGDLVFFQKEGEETGNQMGIVSSCETETEVLRVIEGNSGNEVRENEYNVNDSHIVSYLKISELEESCKGLEEEKTEDTETEEEEEAAGIRTMTAKGPDYTVTVSFTSKAQIPKDAVLEVEEIEQNSAAYQEYYKQSLQAMDAEEISFARYFDVTFLVDGKEIEPSAPVDVKICYTDSIDLEEDASGSAVHFSKDGTEILDAGVDEEEHSFTFTQSSFSVVGTVVAKGTGACFYKGGVPEDLDGKSFLLETVRDTEHIFLTGTAAEKSDGTKGLKGSKTEELSFVEEPEEGWLWTFHKVDETVYYIQNALSGKYLKINGADVTLEEEAVELTVEAGSDWITVRRGSRFLDAKDSQCIAADEKKTESELESWNKFRLFGTGREYILTAEGEDYRITLELTAPEGLLDDAGFTAEEITGETAEVYSQKAQEALGYKEVGFQRFFHLEFDREIPEELLRISSVTIQYKNNAQGFDISGAVGVVQFKGNKELVLSGEEAENTVAAGISAQSDEISEEVLSAEINGQENAISADISTLADVGTVWEAATGDICYKQDIENDEDLDGKDFLITCLYGTKRVMEATEINLSNYAGTPGLRGVGNFAGGDFVSRSASMALWHFEKQSDGTFYISQKDDENAEKNYIHIAGDNSIRLSREPQELTVTYIGDGRVAIQGVRDYINSYGGGSQNGFAGYYDLDEGSKMTLYVYPDVKVSSLEFTMESADLRGNVITEETNPDITEKKRVTIKGKNPYINFENNHPWPGESEATGTKIKYGFSRVQIVYTDEEKVKVREIDQLYVYGSEEEGYEFVFYNNGSYVGNFQPDQVKVQNGYRVIERMEPLDVVPTIRTEDKIKMRMIDYDTGSGWQFTGWGWVNSEAGKGVKQGILRPYLNTDSGYPSFAYEDGYNTGWGEKSAEKDLRTFHSSYYGTDSLEQYFAEATDADYLFLADKYNTEGYYEYKSTENGAVYDGENFTVYKQLTTPVSEASSLYGKGQFLPYNTFEQTRISQGQNLYTAQEQPLDPDHERYGEELYLPDQDANYNFGMELSAEFYQMKNGKVGTNPMIYEFSGDDDLWVYIDGVLVLDLGGCHDARTGHINFSTGEVFVQGIEPTSLYQLFENARNAAVANGADQATIADLNDKLDPSKWKTVNGNKIFADYSRHDFKMWYMERGQGASNLEMRFNLPMIPAGEIQVEKQLANSEQGKYANQLFGFQVYLQPSDSSAGDDTDVFDEDAEKEDYLQFNQSVAEALNASLKDGDVRVTASIVYLDGHREDDVTIPADGTFWLHPGDRLILNGLKANRGYYVRELNPNWDKYSGVTIDQITSSSKDDEGNEVEGDLLELTEAGDADVKIMKVSERSYVAFNNECSEKNRNELRIQKKMGYGESGGDTYEFRVWLEGHDGKLQLYEGTYYLKRRGGSGETALSTDSQKPGIISGISPGDTIIIKELLAETRFLVEEINLGTQYDNPGYEVEYLSRNTDPAGEPDETPDASLTTDENVDTRTEMGTIPLDKDVQVTVTNNRLDESIWRIKKMSQTKGGSCLEAIFELASIETDGKTYYGKSSQADGIITWYLDRECTPANQISVRDIKTGTYQLQEIEAPPGYSLSDEIWTVTVKARCEVEITDQTPDRKTLEGSVGNRITEYTYIFYNTPAYTLPDAGGRGIYWYLIGGMLSMMAGALILYRNKCREVQES